MILPEHPILDWEIHTDVLVIGGGLAGLLTAWDCSCHGSRFSESGDVLDNPANG